MTELLLPVVLVAVIVAVVVFVRRRVAPGPLTAGFMAVAEHRGWQRIPPSRAGEVLAPFGRYLDENTVDLAVGGDSEVGHVVVAAIGVSDRVSTGRPWYVAAVTHGALDIPQIVLEPRNVRTVRVVAGDDEVVIDDARISRGWRILSADEHAAEVLDAPTVRSRLSDALHRPMPFIIGLRTRPGGIAVHLAGPEDQPGDADDIDRLVRLALDIAAAMAAAPA